MKNLENQNSMVCQAESFDREPDMNSLKRRQSCIRRDLIVEGEFCKFEIARKASHLRIKIIIFEEQILS